MIRYWQCRYCYNGIGGTMDTFRKMAEQREREDFNVAEWQDKLTRAQTARNMWDKDAQDCQKIRDNQIPTRGSIKGAGNYSDKFYVDNWIQKSNYWKVSMLMGYDVYFDLKSHNGVRIDDNRELLENEINYAADIFNIMNQTSPVINDWLYFGYGVSYLQWNARAIDRYWKTGKPEFRYIDCRNVWIDEGSDQPDWSDVRWIFALSYADVNELKEIFPEYRDMISASITNEGKPTKNDGSTDKTDVYTIQYKKLYRTRKIELINTATGENEFFLKDDLEEWLKEGNILPETIEISDEFEIDEYCWFQFIYSYSLNLVLSEPKYLGNKHSFQFLTAYRTDFDPYPRSITWYLKDLQEISVIVMTLLVLQAAKMNKPTPVLESGALEDEEEFYDNYDKLGYIPVVNPEWRDQHPNQKPFTFETAEMRPDIPIVLNNMITDSIKTWSGAIDSARGEAQYSGQSGAQTAQLQAAASMYTKQDEIKWHNYLRDIGDKMLSDIAYFRNYEHTILGVDNQGNETERVVNADNTNQFDSQLYYTVPFVDTTPEIMKQMEKDRAIQLADKGWMSPLDAMRINDIPNAELLYQRALESQGILQVVQLLQQNPELMQSILSGSAEIENKKSVDSQNDKG